MAINHETPTAWVWGGGGLHPSVLWVQRKDSGARQWVEYATPAELRAAAQALIAALDGAADETSDRVIARWYAGGE